MKHRIRNLAAASIAFALVAAPSPSDGMYRAEPYYVLGKIASYQTGCFPPCLCPVLQQVPVRGTLRLTPTGFDGTFDTYDVTQVNWNVDVGGPGLPISGSGTYRIGGESSLTQQLELDLVIDGGEPEHFDSGLVATDVERPSIDVAVSKNGMFCHDTVIVVDAAPVKREAMLRYQLVEGSLLREGCVDPCACLLELQRPLRGSFSLLPLERSLWYEQFAVLDIRWNARAPGAPMHRAGIPVTGSGIYQIGGDFALEERLALDLIIDAQDVKRLEGSRVAGGIDFPAAIDVPISTDTACFETAIDVRAKQLPIFAPLRERR